MQPFVMQKQLLLKVSAKQAELCTCICICIWRVERDGHTHCFAASLLSTVTTRRGARRAKAAACASGWRTFGVISAGASNSVFKTFLRKRKKEVKRKENENEI